MKAVNIDWDIDRDDYIDLSEQDMLPPTEVELPGDMIDLDDIVNYLSDEYGWCVNSFDIR